MADNTIANAIKFLKGEEKSLPAAKTEGQVYFAYKNVGTAEKPSYTGAIYIDTPIGGTQNRIKMTANADIADKAFNDSAGLNIRDTYLSSLGYTNDGKQTILIKGSGNNQTRIALPIASTTKSGIVTTDAQSFGGTKTFTTINSTNLTVTGSSGFNYSGIETATESKARPIWFADSSGNGKPVIDTNFTYNPATQTLSVANLSGTAEKATKDNAGNDIRSTYISDVTISGRTITVTKGSGAKVTLTTQDTDTWRGIQNNLTSDSTTDSLSAAQGKYLKSLIDGKSNNGHNHDDRYYTETEINSKLANYLPLSGGTLTGALNFANSIWNVVGDDVAIGDMNIAGTLGVMGKNGNTAIKLVQFGASTTGGDAAPGVAWTCTGNGTSTISGILSGTFSGNLNGNANTASNLNGINTILSTGIENSAITIKTNDNGIFTLTNNCSLRNAIDFRWYETNWQIGNIRGESVNSIGFGFAFKSSSSEKISLKSYIDTNGVYHGGVDKLATARKISLTGDATGSAIFNGETDISISTVTRQTCFVGSDSASSSGWYKVASQTMSGYGDSNIMFAVTSTYSNYYTGIFSLQIRSDNTSIQCPKAEWLVRSGFSADSIKIVISGMTWTMYVNRSVPQYGRIMFEVLTQSSISGKSSGLTMYNTYTKESVTPNATKTSSDGGTVNYANSAYNSTRWNNYENDIGTNNTTDTWLLVANNGKIQHRLTTSFAPASHTHSYLPLSGGIMEGTAFIEWAESGNWNNSNNNVTFPVNRGGLQWYGQSDYVKFFAQETGTDNLELVLQFGDDNSNGLSIRNYAGNETARITANGEFTGTFYGNASTATTAAKLGRDGNTGIPMTFNWSGQSGQPSWLWGGNDGSNMYVYNPSNFNVNYANSAGSVAWGNVSGRPSSMPASDVYAWAKASTKPSYSWGEITGKPSTFTPSSHSHGLIDSNFYVDLANTTTDNGWSMLSSAYSNANYVGHLLKSIRTQANAPAWTLGDYAAGIVFGGADTKGVITCSYNQPCIKFAGGNGAKPVWYISLTGTSGKSYDLNNMPHAETATNSTKWNGRTLDIDTEAGSDAGWLLIDNGGIVRHRSASYFATASHTHPYLPLSGGTMTGNITYGKLGTCYIGAGSSDNANMVGGGFNNLVISSWWGISFTTSCSSAFLNKNAVSIDCRDGVLAAASLRVGNGSGSTINFCTNGGTAAPGAKIVAYNDRIEFVFA